MSDPTPALLTALRLLTLLLGAVFVLFCYEFWVGCWPRPLRHIRLHRWEVDRLKTGVLWLTCRRCGAVAVRGEQR